MAVDSFKYLPRILAAAYQMTDAQPALPIPWAPLARPLAECRLGLITSGGLYHKGIEAPFDIERERLEPTWGDPTFRTIPAGIAQAELGASHLHINTADVLADIDILLPVHRLQELIREGRIAGQAAHVYSFMGYQGYPADTTAWEETYGPQVAGLLKAEGVDGVLLTPA